mgnify:CR=1 FL=1
MKVGFQEVGEEDDDQQYQMLLISQAAQGDILFPYQWLEGGRFEFSIELFRNCGQACIQTAFFQADYCLSYV